MTVPQFKPGDKVKCIEGGSGVYQDKIYTIERGNHASPDGSLVKVAEYSGRNKPSRFELIVEPPDPTTIEKTVESLRESLAVSQQAGMAEQADALDSKPSVFGREGATPSTGTDIRKRVRNIMGHYSARGQYVFTENELMAYAQHFYDLGRADEIAEGLDASDD